MHGQRYAHRNDTQKKKIMDDKYNMLYLQG
jgi:hypothetical protein